MTDHRKPPETALAEVLREIEDAEKRTDPADDERRGREHEGEAADAITPNARAQEESEGD
ncbi:hypothetical protein ACYF6T_00640 [Streptomyces sp. 7R007]